MGSRDVVAETHQPAGHLETNRRGLARLSHRVRNGLEPPAARAGVHRGTVFGVRRAGGLLNFLPRADARIRQRSEEHTSELQSLAYLVCRLLLEKKKTYLDSQQFEVIVF